MKQFFITEANFITGLNFNELEDLLPGITVDNDLVTDGCITQFSFEINNDEEIHIFYDENTQEYAHSHKYSEEQCELLADIGSEFQRLSNFNKELDYQNIIDNLGEILTVSDFEVAYNIKNLNDFRKAQPTDLNELDWSFISKGQILSSEDINKYASFLEWTKISEYQKLDENTMEKYQDKLDWWKICIYQKLSESFITKFEDKVEWYHLLNTQELSDEFVQQYESNFIEAGAKDKLDRFNFKHEIIKGALVFESPDNLTSGDIWVGVEHPKYKHGLFVQFETKELDNTEYDENTICVYAYENIIKNGDFTSNFDKTEIMFEIPKEKIFEIAKGSVSNELANEAKKILEQNSSLMVESIN